MRRREEGGARGEEREMEKRKITFLILAERAPQYTYLLFTSEGQKVLRTLGPFTSKWDFPSQTRLSAAEVPALPQGPGLEGGEGG